MTELVRVGNALEVRGRLSASELRAVRDLPERRFDPVAGCWRVPWTRENHEALSLIWDLEHLEPPKDSSYRIHAAESMLFVQTPYSATNVERCRNIPDHHKWDAATKAWRCKPTGRTLEYLRKTFPEAQWTREAEELHVRVVEAERARVEQLRAEKTKVMADVDATPDDYVFGGPFPFIHQRRAFLLSRDKTAYALLMEQGTGKSKVIVDTACYLYQRGLIDRVLVVAPNSVKTNWVTDEIPIHSSPGVRYRAAYWGGSGGKEQRLHVESVIADTSSSLLWLAMNVEALSTGGAGEAAAERFLKGGTALMVVDESSKIKAKNAQRTRAVLRLGKLAKYRRIATGTPVTQGPIDVYPQFEFLDPAILGFGSLAAFKKHFVEFGGYNDRVIVGYNHLDELQELLKPYSFRVLRDECLDLPPKLPPVKHEVELSKDQRRVYDMMLLEMRAELEGVGRVTTAMVLTQMLRLQQITGGFLPVEQVVIGENGVPVVTETKVEPIPGPNPKIEALLEIAEEVDGKIIVWARFRPEIALISTRLREAYGPNSVVEFHGGVDDEGRIQARTSFQDPSSPVRFFIGQTETGGMGITLTQAKTVVYYSNSFSYEARVQSEDRAHRIGQNASVAYIDLVARDTKDEAIIGAVRNKYNLANAVTGDKWKEWI